MTDIIEMLWGCESCGAASNRGRVKECESCGAPRTATSPEWMPDDIGAGAAITDPGLLRKFLGGKDWRCRYCSSSVFRADGACAQCGSPQGDSPEPKRPTSSPLPLGLDAPPAPPTWWAGAWEHRARIGGAAALAVALSAAVWFLFHERLLDHYDTVAYQVRVSCGQTCTPVPRTCSSTPRTCTSNQNGSATCTGGGTVCTGGGTRCETKYCSETRRRQEPRYRYEPRFEEWYRWKAWEWVFERAVTRAGKDLVVTWPAPAELTLALGPGEKQRESRQTTLGVTFRGDDESFEYTPATEAEFQSYALKTPHRLRTSIAGPVTVVRPEPTK